MMIGDLRKILTLFLFSMILGQESEVSSKTSRVCVLPQLCYQLQVLTDRVVFTVTYPSNYGWVGIGSGIWMQGSDMTLVWQNPDSSVTLSDRRGNGNLEPRPVSTTSILNEQGSQVVNKNMQVVFSKLKTQLGTTLKNQVEALDTVSMIWAYSLVKPESNPNTTLTYHDDCGTFSLNLASGESNSQSIVNLWALVHGVVLFFGWNLFPFLGILAAGPLRPKLGQLWFRIHVSLLGVVSPLVAVAGIVLAIVGQSKTHFGTIHEILGLIVMLLMLIQIILGVVIDKLWNPQRTKAPWYDQLHWYLGRLLFLLAQINIILGLVQYSVSQIYFILYPILLGFQVLFYLLLTFPHRIPSLANWLRHSIRKPLETSDLTPEDKSIL